MSVHTIFILYIYLRIIKAVVYPYASNSHMRYYWWFFELFLTENQFQWKQICPILIMWILTMHAAMAKIPVVLNHIFDIQLIVWYITLTRLTNSHYLYEFVLRKKCIPKSFSILLIHVCRFGVLFKNVIYSNLYVWRFLSFLHVSFLLWKRSFGVFFIGM